MNVWRWAQERWFGTRAATPEHLRRGRMGEDAARQYLERSGLKFLTANFRSSHGEIDLIFRDDDCLVFVEVKTRSSERWGNPETAVSDAKIKRMVAAADHYLKTKETNLQIRFDVISIIFNKKQTEIIHIEDAFFPPLNG